MKLLAKILRYVENNGNGAALDPPEVSGYTPIQVSYHVSLCSEAGFLNITTVFSDPPQHTIRHLTWKGHEFLDKNRHLLD